jgi:hypothetical protein
MGVIASALASAAAETSSEPASRSWGLIWLFASPLLAGHFWFAVHFLRPLLRRPRCHLHRHAVNVVVIPGRMAANQRFQLFSGGHGGFSWLEGSGGPQVEARLNCAPFC